MATEAYIPPALAATNRKRKHQSSDEAQAAIREATAQLNGLRPRSKPASSLERGPACPARSYKAAPSSSSGHRVRPSYSACSPDEAATIAAYEAKRQIPPSVRSQMCKRQATCTTPPATQQSTIMAGEPQEHHNRTAAEITTTEPLDPSSEPAQHTSESAPTTTKRRSRIGHDSEEMTPNSDNFFKYMVSRNSLHKGFPIIARHNDEEEKFFVEYATSTCFLTDALFWPDEKERKEIVYGAELPATGGGRDESEDLEDVDVEGEWKDEDELMEESYERAYMRSQGYAGYESEEPESSESEESEEE